MLTDYEFHYELNCRNSYLQLSNKNLGINKKKQIISQRGGFISTLVGIAIPLISSLVTALSK